jgi:hypothetical protein
VPLSTDAKEIAEAIKTTLTGGAGLQAVYLSDQELVPAFPSASVEAPTKRRTIKATRQFKVTFRIPILIYHGPLKSTTTVQSEVMATAESVENLLHADFTLGGRVLFGYVTSIEPGVVVRSSAVLRSSRLVWEALSQETF